MSNAAALAASYEGLGTLDEHMAQLAKVKRARVRRRVDAVGLARTRRWASAALRCCAVTSVRRSTARGLVDPGIYSMTEVLAPTMIDFADAGAGGGDGAAPVAWRRDVVPGLLRAGHRQQPRGSGVPRRARRGRLRVNGQKVWTSFAHHAQRCVLLMRTGTVESAHRGHHRACSSTWTRRASRCGPSRPCTARTSSLRCSSTTFSCPSPAAGRGRPGLVGRHGPAPVRTSRPRCGTGARSCSADLTNCSSVEAH